ncbi:transporter substrate-binding domain-containing protein [Methylobacillus arboreus]|uniref:transporter substrate-binding domain-containing protein n=1 Tax=Methylobacillus arboreus TaxID=755170 RepID=UPI001E42BB87|nr:transporter substrate-binding domain-containing protein [Methylobacillus arboreus]MCB5190178.1 transporter substrate-binding domain-containing protein [Methylobacillus arboreus]
MPRRISALASSILTATLFISSASAVQITASERADLAPTGKLRIGINTGNILLTGKDLATGTPRGIVFDLARELEGQVGLPVEIVTFDSAGELAEGIKTGAWDVAFLGIEPERAEGIAFSPPYAEIVATYLVPAGSSIKTIADVDKEGVRIAISAKSAYDLVLTRSLKHAKLHRVPGAPGVPGVEGAYNLFASEKLEVLAALKPVLIEYTDKLPGSRVLDGSISTVYQAIGTPKDRDAGAKFLQRFVEEIKANGLVAKTITKNGARGLSVAPAQTLGFLMKEQGILHSLSLFN